MQAIYAWYCTNEEPATTFDINLRDFADEIQDFERRKGDKGDLRLLTGLFYDTIKHHEDYDVLIQSKAENWELERIALIDRILMQMGISEMKNFEEIPIKVTINEYLEIAKKFSTPKSSKFINGILDSLYIQFKQDDQIQKSGRGLIEETLPKRRSGGYGGGRGGHNSPRQNSGYQNRPVDNRRDEPVPPSKEASSETPPAPKDAEKPVSKKPSTPDGEEKKKRPRIRKSDSENI